MFKPPWCPKVQNFKNDFLGEKNTLKKADKQVNGEGKNKQHTNFIDYRTVAFAPRLGVCLALVHPLHTVSFLVWCISLFCCTDCPFPNVPLSLYQRLSFDIYADDPSIELSHSTLVSLMLNVVLPS